MNSKLIKSKFNDVYRDFFSCNEIVLSGNFSMSWGPGGIIHRSEYMRIKSKVPLKCYIGINKIKENKIIFKNVIFYELNKEKFEIEEYKKVNPEIDKVVELVTKTLQSDGFKGGLEISFLSETPRGHSFGFAGTSGALLSIGIFILTNKIYKEELEDLNKLEKGVKEELEDLAWKFDLISTYGNTAGHSALNTLFNFKSATILYTQIFDENLKIEDTKNICRKLICFNEQYAGEIITNTLPCDYGIIFSGLSTDTKKIEEYKRGFKKKLTIYKDFINNDIKIIENISFGKYGNEINIEKTQNDIINLLMIKNVYFFKKLLENGHNEEITNDFIENINLIGANISLFEKQNNFSDNLKYFFYKHKKSQNENIGLLPIYSGKLGGGYLFVMHQGISRDTLNKAIKEIKTQYINSEIEYCSYIDGNETEGIKLEQYISEGIYSEYIQKDKFILKNINGESYIGNYNELLEKEKKGILLDLINNKIYINGEKLTSKDIPSQNTTIEILIKLIENIGKDISNKELSSSTYSKSKGEMIGKIIVPITKIIEEKIGEKIELICKGSLTDFYIKLENPKISIFILRKI